MARTGGSDYTREVKRFMMGAGGERENKGDKHERYGGENRKLGTLERKRRRWKCSLWRRRTAVS